MGHLWRNCVVAAGVSLLVACSDTSKDGAETDASGATIEQTGPTTSTVPDVTEIVHQPASGDFVGALADITDHTCEKTVEGWRVTGTATNPTTDTADYRIYVSLINGAATTRALVETEVAGVAAGQGGSFDILIVLPDDDLRCVLRVERRASGG